MMGELSLIQLLERVGFPIFVVLWFMLRFEKRLDRLADSHLTLAKSNETLVEKILEAERKRAESLARLSGTVSGEIGTEPSRRVLAPREE